MEDNNLMFVPWIIRRSRYNQHNAQICTTAGANLCIVLVIFTTKVEDNMSTCVLRGLHS
jgi:hypothetical protein